MGVTVIRAIANMNAGFVVNLTYRGTEVDVAPYPEDSLDGDTAHAFESVGSIDYPIPWGRSAEEFSRRHLILSLLVPGGLGFRPLVYYSLWQQDFGGADLVRYSENGGYFEGAPGLAGRRNGELYDPRGDSDALLVVDERRWVILTRIR